MSFFEVPSLAFHELRYYCVKVLNIFLSQTLLLGACFKYFSKSNRPRLALARGPISFLSPSTISAQQRLPLCLHPVAVRAGPGILKSSLRRVTLPIPIPMSMWPYGPSDRSPRRTAVPMSRPMPRLRHASKLTMHPRQCPNCPERRRDGASRQSGHIPGFAADRSLTFAGVPVRHGALGRLEPFEELAASGDVEEPPGEDARKVWAEGAARAARSVVHPVDSLDAH